MCPFLQLLHYIRILQESHKDLVSHMFSFDDLSKDILYQRLSTPTIESELGTVLKLAPRTNDGFCRFINRFWDEVLRWHGAFSFMEGLDVILLSELSIGGLEDSTALGVMLHDICLISA
jgi:hypothetical protein